MKDDHREHRPTQKFSDAEKAAILAEADADGASVRQVAERHEVAENLTHNWRPSRRQAAAIASEAPAFIPYGAIIMTEPAAASAVTAAREAAWAAGRTAPARRLSGRGLRAGGW